MAQVLRADFEGHSIEVVNKLLVCKLLVDGVIADVYWGVFALQVRLYGSFTHNNKRHRVKAVVGAKHIYNECAIFVDDALVNSSIPI